MLFILLSVLDIIAGAALYSQSISTFILGAVSAIALILLFKGAWTFFSAIVSGYAWHSWSGALDVIAGVALIMTTYNMFPASQILGGAVIAKGSWYLLRSILKF